MFYLGIDVSKQKLHGALLMDVAADKRRTKSVENSPEGVKTLVDWATRQGAAIDQLHAVLEATGPYHEVAALALCQAGVRVTIANPAQVRDFARGLAVRTKTDGVDSGVLARYGALVQPPLWEPPAPEVRELQALLARRDAVAADLQRERNRHEKAEVTGQTGLVLLSIENAIVFLQAELRRLDKAIDDHIDRHPDLKDKLQLLQTIPAVGEQVGKALLSVMTARTFHSAEQLAAYLGLIPVECQSGTSVLRRARLSKAGPTRVRKVLYMAAVVATRFNPHVRALYERLLAKGKSKMAAIGAAMRKMVHLCFGVLNSGRPYDPNWHPSA
jgi:transposase